MCVVRVKKTNNFVVIHKGVLEDTFLSFKAKGLWAYCMSRPDDWVFKVAHLINVSTDGKDAIYSALDELIERGYAKKIQLNIKGKFSQVDYEVYETAQLKKSLPLPGLPLPVLPLPENPPLLSIEEELRIEKRRGREAAPPHASPQKIYKEHKRVKIEITRFENLVQEFGLEKIMEMMEKLDQYADINPKRFKGYGCHGGVIRKWIFDDEDKKREAHRISGTSAENKEISGEGENRAWETMIKKIAKKAYTNLASGIEFTIEDGKYLKISYSDDKFQTRVSKELKKRGILV